jgi:integrase
MSQKRVQDGTVRYLARWWDEADKQHTKSFRLKGDADPHEALMAVNRDKGISVDPTTGRISLREYVQAVWLPSLKADDDISPRTVETYISQLDRHILPVLGSRQLGSLRRPDMAKFVTKTRKKVAPSTTKTIFAVLRSALQSAVDGEVIPANPCSHVPLPKVDRRQPKDVADLSVEIIKALADAMPPRYAVTIWLAACTGLREGEILGLKVPKIDFLRRCVHVEQQMQTTGGTRPRLSEPKSPAGFRTVPIDNIVLEALSQHVAQFPPGPDDLLVTNRLRKPVRRSSFGHCWRSAVEAVGLPKGTRFHDLRHWYAGKLIDDGATPHQLKLMMGHDNLASTDVYSYLYVKTEDMRRGALDAAFRSAQGPRATGDEGVDRPH